MKRRDLDLHEGFHSVFKAPAPDPSLQAGEDLCKSGLNFEKVTPPHQGFYLDPRVPITQGKPVARHGASAGLAGWATLLAPVGSRRFFRPVASLVPHGTQKMKACLNHSPPFAQREPITCKDSNHFHFPDVKLSTNPSAFACLPVALQPSPQEATRSPVKEEHDGPAGEENQGKRGDHRPLAIKHSDRKPAKDEGACLTCPKDPTIQGLSLGP